MAAASELTNTFKGRPANQSKASRMMTRDTVCPRSGWATMSASAMTAAGSSGISISRRLARSIRREASRWAPQTAKAILVSSEGCIDRPPTTNQPRVPLASCPIPGISTRTSRTIVVANPANATRRRKLTGRRKASQQANSPTAAHIT